MSSLPAAAPSLAAVAFPTRTFSVAALRSLSAASHLAVMSAHAATREARAAQSWDSLHALVRDFRDARKIVLNVEHRLMLHFAPDLESLTLQIGRAHV